MANPEHVKVVRQGAAAIAKWRRQNPGVLLDLSTADLHPADPSAAPLVWADLTGANLTGANLFAVSLIKANLSHADLTGANLGMANLSGANLAKAVLRRSDLFAANLVTAYVADADLTGANLLVTNLPGAHLTGTTLTGVDLRGANLTGADVGNASLARASLGFGALADCDLSRAKGLSAVKHRGPSSIGVDTLIRSFRGAGNKLTSDLETFFLGAGVPKELLAELPRIVGAVEYYSCFICYGQPDVDFATRLRGDLVAKGVPCWLYALDATPGERTWKEIGRERRQADKMVVICSAASLIRDGVLNEIEDQIDEDPDKMVPISRDDIWIQTGFRVARGSRDLGPFLRDRNYADFSDDSLYEESLQRLLKALRRKAE